MIELTKLNEMKITVNADLIEVVEETPDTIVTLTTGKKIIVKETRQEVANLVKSYKRDVFTKLFTGDEV
ncbi:MAG: flagellar FlbD family protein [Lachnospiraceae bacterium]|nr:flagellar FlbD family protein [Lachnospiraceae bacterium]